MISTESNAEKVEKTERVEKIESTESYYEYDDQAEWEALQASDIDWAALNGIRESVDNLTNLAVCANFLLALLLGVCLCKIFSQYITIGGRR